MTHIVELQLGLLEEQRDLAEVITVNLRQSSRLLKQYATPLFMQYIDVIAGVVRDGQEAGAFRKDLNPRVVARSLFGALDAIADVGSGRRRPGSTSKSRLPLRQPVSRRPSKALTAPLGKRWTTTSSSLAAASAAACRHFA
ncbi:MAG: hypothetical protein EP303_05160 [Deltaproteobacteria bacterium]|nr:MAG: hypothetical protein EP303_05160 [Deltaproteobacteria bacterium]